MGWSPVTWQVSQVTLTEGLPRITPQRSPEIWHRWLRSPCFGAWRTLEHGGIAERPQRSPPLAWAVPVSPSCGDRLQEARVLSHSLPLGTVHHRPVWTGSALPSGHLPAPATLHWASDTEPGEVLPVTSAGPCQWPFWALASPGTTVPSVVLRALQVPQYYEIHLWANGHLCLEQAGPWQCSVQEPLPASWPLPARPGPDSGSSQGDSALLFIPGNPCPRAHGLLPQLTYNQMLASESPWGHVPLQSPCLLCVP